MTRENDTIRVRFAPSPTGFLHVGGARTALFNWLFARHHAGVFVLRIEDTDRQRSSEEMTRAILEGMTWLGLEWDEGPYHQADGLDRHVRDVRRLLEGGHAYRCFCTAEQLEERKSRAEDPRAFRYDRHCVQNVTAEEAERRAAAGEPHAIRFKVPDAGRTAWDDAVHGRTEFDNAAIEDFVVLRTDGTPIYNLAVVSDDIEMAITHVIRGDDHLSNTPKQILIYEALGARVPTFAHVPMILGPDGKRLSKRHGATAVGEYEERGILPEAMTNFLALLGWSPGTDEEILTAPELITRFTLEGINKKSAIFDTQKLEWLNGQYLMRTPAADLEPLVARRLLKTGKLDEATRHDRHDWMLRLIDLLKPRARTVNEIAAMAVPYLGGPVEYDPGAVDKHWKNPGEVRERMERLRDRLAALPEDGWNEETLEAELRGFAEALGVGAGKVIHPLRLAVTGLGASPGIFEVLVLLGRDLSIERLDAALDQLGATEA